MQLRVAARVPAQPRELGLDRQHMLRRGFGPAQALRELRSAGVACTGTRLAQLLDMHPIIALAALPWLQGFFAPESVTESDSHGSRDVLAELAEWREPVADCVASTYGGLTLRADVSAAEGRETILASYTQGVFVFDHDRHLLAQAQPLPCEGSADELLAIAAGDASIGVPLIALAATSGGHRENITWLTLYRVANDGVLQPVFTGEVERHEGDTARTGVVTLVPGGLVYRDTRGSIGLWLYDAGRGRYVEQFTVRPNA
jgi:hypothetical protein